MVLEKKSLYSRVYKVAERLNMKQTKVAEVVNSYFTECRNDLFEGRVVRILGFATLVPDVVLDEFVCTTAMYCKRVSNTVGITYFTVREVMREYFDSCKEELFECRTVDFRRLVHIYPVSDGEKICNVHAAISVTVKADMKNISSGVTSARAHICKVLKSELQQVKLLEVSS